MYRSRLKTAKKTLLAGYLAIALVFMHGLRLHVHIYDHDQTASDHAHQVQAHVAYAAAETAHPDEVAEIDLSPDGFLKKLSSGTLIIAMIMAVLMLMPRRRCVRIALHLERRIATPPFSLRPPLRAPPL